MAANSVFVGRAGAGDLHPAYTLGGALVATGLVASSLLFAFSRRLEPPAPPASMLLRIVQNYVALPLAMPPKPKTRERKPSVHSRPTPFVQSLPPPVTAGILPNLVAPARPKLNLSMGLTSPTQPLPAVSGPRVANPYSNLYRALNAPAKPGSPLKSNGSFRSDYGYTESKVDGICSYTVLVEHLSLSPSVHPHVAFAIPCAGDTQPNVGEVLRAWAKQEKKRQDGGGLL